MKCSSPSIFALILRALIVSAKPLYPRATSTSLSISLPTSSSSNVIDVNFPGFGFEEASFVNYVLDADGNTNEFSVNLIESLTSRTGGTPIIRLGGTSADYALYVANQTVPALPLATDGTNYDVGGTTIGPSYWALTSILSAAEYMIQVPLVNTNINETILWAKTAVAGIASNQIHSIEIGNEPDWYSATYEGTEGVLGPPEWQTAFTNETYVGNYTEYAEAIVANVDLPSTQIFQAFDTAAHVGAYSAILCYELDVETAFDLGIDDDGYIKTVAHHYYQNAGGDSPDELPIGSGLMNLTFTHWRMDFFHCQLDYLEANRPDLPFVLSEVGNSLADEYVPQYQAVLGSALWQVDFYLYAMVLGISRVHYQQMFAETYQPIMWLPVEYLGIAPHVTANYYSQPFIGDFIGNSGATTVEQLDISPAQENVAAYAAYESGSPKRVAVVNMNYWNEATSGTDRSSVSIDLSAPSDATTATVNHLDSPSGAGADATTITYGGSQWTYESSGTEVTGVRNDTETLTVSDGIVTVTLNASSAILVSFS
ncbi:hypothetical protein N0V82_009420 [Gnomoniopsis sp. IMI 355080]|nr:hypothetical protein N0V82_009420 [Gnomoniopsis sp. IMI 355080]